MWSLNWLTTITGLFKKITATPLHFHELVPKYSKSSHLAYTSRCLFSTNATMLDNSGSWRWFILTDSVPATIDCLEALEIPPVVRLSSACEDTTEPLICRLEPAWDDRLILLPSKEYLGANVGKLILFNGMFCFGVLFLKQKTWWSSNWCHYLDASLKTGAEIIRSELPEWQFIYQCHGLGRSSRNWMSLVKWRREKKEGSEWWKS